MPCDFKHEAGNPFDLEFQPHIHSFSHLSARGQHA